MRTRSESLLDRRAFVMGAGALALGLAGCGSPRNSEPETPAEEASASDEEPQAEGASPAATDGAASKTLVVFYSRAGENYGNGGTEVIEVGHTKVMAGYIAEALGADTYEIVPAQPYPDSYEACCDQASDELGSDARPAIAGELPDVSAYDTVFVGCPIWWGCEPMIVRTFLDGVDLSGKTIVPFTTHGGSGLGSVPSDLEARIADATFLEAKAVAGTAVDSSRDEVVAWAQGLFT